jgi:hypothetical protein
MKGFRAAATVAVFAVCCAAGSTRPVADVKYELDGWVVRVPVRLAGADLWFDVDTGARHTVVDATTARRLHLVITGGGAARGAGRGTAALQYGAPVTIGIGAARVRVDPWILDLSHVGLSRRADGLVGADVFAKYVVRMDPATKTFGLYDPATFRPPGGGATVPMRVADNRFFVPMKLSISNGVTVTRSMRVDTGSNDAVSDNLVRQSPTRRKSVQGVGIGQSYVDYSGEFSAVAIGPYVFHRVWGPSNDKPAVGMEILHRFVLTFDAPHERLYLAPPV